MGDLSKNFSRSEFKCKCGECYFDYVDAELVKVLQDLHDFYELTCSSKIRIKINSGCRCQNHNISIGGSTYSQHVHGKAADIVVEFLSNITKQWGKIKSSSVYEVLNDKYPDKYGIGKYDTFTHIDVRPKKARW